MSYHRALGAGPPAFSSTVAFAEAVDPYSQRFSPPGSIYSPYGWGPDFNIGMPMNYSHHIDYVREPVGAVDWEPVPFGQPAGHIGGSREWWYWTFGPGSKIAPRPGLRPRRRVPAAVARGRRLGTRPIGPMFDQVLPYAGGQRLGNYESLGDSGDGLGSLDGILAVL